MLFGKNVCENERIGSCGGGGGHAPDMPPLDLPMPKIPVIFFRSVFNKGVIEPVQFST